MWSKGMAGLLGLSLCLAGCAGSRDLGPLAWQVFTGQHAPTIDGSSRPDSVLVVSYNIAFARECELAARELAADPRLGRADILLLQEMDPAGTELVARRLGMNYVYCPAYVHRHHGRPWGTAILTRWPVVGHDSVVLPHPNPFSNNHRRAAVADIAVGGQVVRAISLHLSTVVIGLPGRLEQLRTLLQQAGDTPHPLILGGDFNNGNRRELTRMRQTLRRFGLRQVRLPDEGTAQPGPLDLLGTSLQLDHFFFRGLRAGSAGLGRNYHSSDHTPIWAILAWDEDW